MPEYSLPAHGWKPRWYQEELWNYLKPKKGEYDTSRHAEVIWHRRAGKDEVALNHAACAMMEKSANYWHMLPKSNQVRKAIWEATNPRTGRKRIHEAFPEWAFEYRDTDMLVRCKANDSTWQCLGSDNYEGAIGSSPAGIVYSEWALANPSARGYLRPILTENKGYQIYITTPRGKNHAYSTYKGAIKNPHQFAQTLTIEDTQVLTPDELLNELREYGNTYGETQGLALFEQEYYCSFEAAILGAYYGEILSKIERQGRICSVPHEPNYPVHVAMDIGYDDDTAIWWFQVIANEVRILECDSASGMDVDYYCGMLIGQDVTINFVNNRLEVEYGASNEFSHRQAYTYGALNLPHDAKAKTLAAKGKSVEEQFAKVFGWNKVRIVPRLSQEDGIQATRRMLKNAVFDISTDTTGIEACRQYHREWDDDKKMFKDKPEHDWTSHYADGLRYLAIAYATGKLPKEMIPVRYEQDRTFKEMMKKVRAKRNG